MDASVIAPHPLPLSVYLALSANDQVRRFMKMNLHDNRAPLLYEVVNKVTSLAKCLPFCLYAGRVGLPLPVLATVQQRTRNERF